jgi:hypothetical protein
MIPIRIESRSWPSAIAFATAFSVLTFATCSSAWGQTAAIPVPSAAVKRAVVAYSQEFARRFALEAPSKELELAAPLQALEFRVERSRWQPELNECLLSAYIDARVPLYFPHPALADSQAISLRLNHFFIHPLSRQRGWQKLSIEDRDHLSRIHRTFNRNAAFSTADYEPPGRRGGFFDVGNDEFRRELFPGLNYLRLGVGCHLPRWFGLRHPMLLWLKREDGKDYSRILSFDPQDFERFELPRAFVERMSALANDASKDASGRSSAEAGANSNR